MLLLGSACMVIDMEKSMLILIAGPYRSGTNDEPERLAENLAFL
jgi:hypothetical protein